MHMVVLVLQSCLYKINEGVRSLEIGRHMYTHEEEYTYYDGHIHSVCTYIYIYMYIYICIYIYIYLYSVHARIERET